MCPTTPHMCLTAPCVLQPPIMCSTTPHMCPTAPIPNPHHLYTSYTLCVYGIDSIQSTYICRAYVCFRL